jgi:hypothetical protein
VSARISLIYGSLKNAAAEAVVTVLKIVIVTNIRGDFSTLSRAKTFDAYTQFRVRERSDSAPAGIERSARCSACHSVMPVFFTHQTTSRRKPLFSKETVRSY